MRSMCVLASVALLAGFAIAGCGGSGGSTVPAPAPSQGSVEVLGTWMVQGQSAMQYSLTFYADNTYRLTYAGASKDGTYTVKGTTIGLTPTGGPGMSLEFVKGEDMSRDQLKEAGGVTWSRV